MKAIAKIISFAIQAIGLFLVGALVWALWPASPRFSEKNIADVKQSIRQKYTRDHFVDVAEVVMLAESDRKLRGYIIGKSRTGLVVTLNCEATMDEKGEHYFWNCGQ